MKDLDSGVLAAPSDAAPDEAEGEGVVCEACEARLEEGGAGQDRTRRRRRLGAFMLVFLFVGPALWMAGIELVEWIGRRR